MSRCVQNSARCLSCGVEIVSVHRHDWVSCDCYTDTTDNTGIWIDGGLAGYRRMGGNSKNFQDTSIYVEDTKDET